MNSIDSFQLHLMQHQSSYRIGFFVVIFTLMALWESLAPARSLRFTRAQRWPSNIGLSILNTLVLRLLFPFALVGVAVFVQGKGWGLFNLLTLPLWLSTLACIILLDLIIYGQHVLAHWWPPLWRLHRVHHADQDFDLTTGARFHTLEIVFSFCLKILAVLLLGAPALAIVLFEVVLSSMALFNHSNITLPRKWEKIVRPVFVTPDMHRIHHSVNMHETNSNYGFNLSIWDRLFGTYRAQAQGELKIGLKEFPKADVNHHLWRLLLIPFQR